MVLQLLLQGGDITLVHTQFRQSMELHGLEGAVDIFFSTIRSDAKISRLAATRLQTPTTGLPYVGITDTVPCAKRAADDIAQGAPVVFVNFLNANSTLTYTVYRIPSLDTPTQTPSDLRTNPVIGHKERILRALLGCSTLNSAPGGGTPIFEPTEEMIAIQDRLTASLLPFDFPLGEERDESLEQRIEHLIDDEVQLLRPCHPTKMTPTVVQFVKSQVSSVLRLKRGRLVRLNMAKDIPLEGILDKTGYWDAGVGPGPQEDRHLHCLLDDAIPPNGDLSEDVIARWVGPLLNFWRCTLSHLLYLLHLLLLARFLAELRPLLIFAQSNPVSAALRSGDLALSTNSLPEEVHHQLFEDRKSSPELLGAFPSDVRYRQTRGSAFNQQLGRITLILVGVDPALLALLVSMPDCGELKYDPALAPFRWNVDFLICLVARAVTHRISSRLDSDVPDWSDAAASKAWLLEVKADAESILQSAGVTAALEVAKSRARRAEPAVTFLRTIMSSSRGGSKNDYKRRAGLEAAAGTEARTVQLNSILAHAQLLDSLDLPPDPDYLAPFEHPILSDTFPAWFLSLKDGTEIVQSTNAHGRSAEAVKAVKEWQAQFVNSNRCTELSILQTAQNGMIEVMHKLMRPQSYLVKEIKDSAQLVHCNGCDWSGLGYHNFSFHDCRSRGMLTITESNFPDLERVLYVHEILHDRCSLILGDLAPVLAQLQLIAVPVQEILLFHKEEFKSALCDMDVAAILSALQSDLKDDLDVYVTEDDRNNIGLLVTLAVDVVLKQRSRCPHWFLGDATPLYIAACPGPDGCKRRPHVFVTTKASLRQRRSVAGQVKPGNAGQIEPSNATHTIKGGRACNNCIVDGKNEKNCVGRRFFETETILDLPPHFSWVIWYQYRLGVEWPAPRSSKKRKAKRNFATAFKRRQEEWREVSIPRAVLSLAAIGSLNMIVVNIGIVFNGWCGVLDIDEDEDDTYQPKQTVLEYAEDIALLCFELLGAGHSTPRWYMEVEEKALLFFELLGTGHSTPRWYMEVEEKALLFFELLGAGHSAPRWYWYQIARESSIVSLLKNRWPTQFFSFFPSTMQLLHALPPLIAIRPKLRSQECSCRKSSKTEKMVPALSSAKGCNSKDKFSVISYYTEETHKGRDDEENSENPTRLRPCNPSW
ncbi:hypothetical protein DFH08DRAFT_825746 [Mycena albidolilacea]|uniref:Uncharacterized protein n=1 Tax=Mycena albidolilacea TaxID=1033008 RepID=A0AAD6Z256_9AGAR|nr:hypothetical protein DFH08DRAFT_825746 [Mycena albidolilacea]